MAKYVFTFLEDTAVVNGKSPNPTELLEKMKLRGTVEDFDKVEATIRADYQSRIDTLTKKLTDISNQELTEEEIIWLNFIRERKAIETDGFVKQIAARDKIIDDVRADSAKRAEVLAAFAEQLREMAN